MEEDQIEYVLMTKREVNIYQIPPSQTARGHSVEDKWAKVRLIFSTFKGKSG
jgi:hypothetical protein